MTHITVLDGNYATYNPSLLIVRDRGYEVRVKSYRSPENGDRTLYFAIRDTIQLVGTSGPELLGLVILWETYGDTWNRQSPDILDEVLTIEEQ